MVGFGVGAVRGLARAGGGGVGGLLPSSISSYVVA